MEIKHSGTHSICVPIDILIYQNRQLSHLVRELRKRNRKDLHVTAESGDSIVSQLVEENERLKSDKRSLYTRLEKLAVEYHRECKASRVGWSPAKDMKDDISSSVVGELPISTNEDKDLLRQELNRIKQTLILQQAKEADGQYLLDSLSKSITSLEVERSVWISKATSMETLLNRTQMDFTCRMEEIISTTQLVEGTYLKEIETMSEEIALLHQRLRKSREDIAVLEALHKNITDSTHSAFPDRMIEGSKGDTEVEDETVKHLRMNLSKIQSILKSKDEQVSRILSQHVQLQQTISSMEQENALLRLQLDSDSTEFLTAGTADMLTEIRTINKQRIHDQENASSPQRESCNILATQQHDINRTGLDAAERGRHCNELVGVLQTENDKLTKEVKELQRFKTMVPLSNREGTSSLLEIELEDVKSRIRCSLCEQRDKNVVITACMHCFCRQCVEEKMLNARNRKCPLCNQRFADAEVKDVHFLVR